MDLKFLAGAFSPLVNSQHEASIASGKDLILEQAMAIATGKSEKPDPLAQRLNAWLDSAQVTCITSLSPLAPLCFDTPGKTLGGLCRSCGQEVLAARQSLKGLLGASEANLVSLPPLHQRLCPVPIPLPRACRGQQAAELGRAGALQDRMLHVCRSRATAALKESHANFGCFRKPNDLPGSPEPAAVGSPSATSQKSLGSRSFFSSMRS